MQRRFKTIVVEWQHPVRHHNCVVACNLEKASWRGKKRNPGPHYHSTLGRIREKRFERRKRKQRVRTRCNLPDSARLKVLNGNSHIAPDSIERGMRECELTAILEVSDYCHAQGRTPPSSQTRGKKPCSQV